MLRKKKKKSRKREQEKMVLLSLSIWPFLPNRLFVGRLSFVLCVPLCKILYHTAGRCPLRCCPAQIRPRQTSPVQPRPAPSRPDQTRPDPTKPCPFALFVFALPTRNLPLTPFTKRRMKPQNGHVGRIYVSAVYRIVRSDRRTVAIRSDGGGTG